MRHLVVAHGWQSLRRERGQVLRQVENALSTVSANQFPLLFAFKEALLYGDGNMRSEWALDAILDGIVGGEPPLRTPRGPSGKSRANGGQRKK